MARTNKSNSKPAAASCRNHGGCPYCLGNRMHKHVKQQLKSLPSYDPE